MFIKKITNATSLSDMLQSTLFKVEKRPLYMVNNSGIQERVNHEALVKADDGDILYIGKQYTPIENKTIVDAISKLPMDIVKINNYNNRVFEYNLVGNQNFKFGEEPAKFMMRIVNSYDGSKALRVDAGVYVLVCSNGAVSKKHGFNFGRKHTVGLGENEIAGFIEDSTNKMDGIINLFQNKTWHNNQEQGMQQFNELVKIFPESKTGEVHPMIEGINSRAERYSEKYDIEFSLFMAATDFSTHKERFGLSSSYARKLDSQISDVFMN
jgi:hypothetical protein